MLGVGFEPTTTPAVEQWFLFEGHYSRSLNLSSHSTSATDLIIQLRELIGRYRHDLIVAI